MRIQLQAVTDRIKTFQVPTAGERPRLRWPARTRLAAWGGLLVGLVAFLAFGLTHLEGFRWDPDEGIYLMWGRLVESGYPLYTKVWSDQTPGLPVLLAWLFKVFGTQSLSGGAWSWPSPPSAWPVWRSSPTTWGGDGHRL